jgi:hypothetical protein
MKEKYFEHVLGHSTSNSQYQKQKRQFFSEEMEKKERKQEEMWDRKKEKSKEIGRTGRLTHRKRDKCNKRKRQKGGKELLIERAIHLSDNVNVVSM